MTHERLTTLAGRLARHSEPGSFTLPCVLTIAGSDSSGGAGIQADLKTIEALGLYGASAITALTAQNTTGVSGVLPTPPEFIEAQVDAVFEDIVPAAVKIGMVGTAEAARAIGHALRRWGAGGAADGVASAVETPACASGTETLAPASGMAEAAARARQQTASSAPASASTEPGPALPIVLDPVMVATSGASLSGDSAVRALVDELFSLATVVTPNIPEAEALSGLCIVGEPDPHAAMESAADAIARLTSGAVLVKGGHATADADDLLRLADGSFVWLRGERVDAANTHGTGCTLSSAIACGLARGLEVEPAVREAKAYLTGALRAGLDLGRGSGPVDHLWQLRA